MRTFGKVITAICDGVAKVFSFIFGTLGLWLPTVYAVVFLVACGLSDVPISGRLSVLFYCGLVLTVVLGFAFSMWLRSVRKKRDLEAGNIPERKKKKKYKDVGAISENNSYAPYQSMPASRGGVPNGYANPNSSYGYSQGNNYAPPPPQYGGNYSMPPQGYAPPPPAQSGGYMQNSAMPPQSSYGQGGYSGGYAPQNGYVQNNAQNSYAQTAPAQSRPVQNEDNSDLERKYFSNKPAPEPERFERTVSFDSDDAVKKAYGMQDEKEARKKSTEYSLGTDELWRRLTGTDVPDEQPLVFRTRKDPDLYVYEYSDRYQYWRRTRHGMVLDKTEFKTETNRR